MDERAEQLDEMIDQVVGQQDLFLDLSKLSKLVDDAYDEGVIAEYQWRFLKGKIRAQEQRPTLH